MEMRKDFDLNRKAVYPGSFDPITKGHVDLVKRLSCFFNPLVLLVSTSASKKYLFSLKERVTLVRTCLQGHKQGGGGFLRWIDGGVRKKMQY